MYSNMSENYTIFIKIQRILTTIVFCGTGSIFAPGEVKPGHIMLAPLITNLMAPKSTCSLGRKNGSIN